jgi:hypothetical protein
MPDRPKDLLNVAPETVVLAFDIAGWTSPGDAERIARSKEVVAAMNKALAEQGRQVILSRCGGKAV